LKPRTGKDVRLSGAEEEEEEEEKPLESLLKSQRWLLASFNLTQKTL